MVVPSSRGVATKRSVSMDADVYSRVVAEAGEQGMSVSAALNEGALEMGAAVVTANRAHVEDLAHSAGRRIAVIDI